MKKNKIIYWASTGIISAMMLFSAFGYFTNEEMKNGFTHLGFPDYFRIELGAAKAIGALALLIPMIPVKLKEFAYAGFGIVFISAIIAHLASGDAVSMAITPVVMLGILSVSYIYYKKE
jgi:hypothetical protein